MEAGQEIESLFFFFFPINTFKPHRTVWFFKKKPQIGDVKARSQTVLSINSGIHPMLYISNI